MSHRSQRGPETVLHGGTVVTPDAVLEDTALRLREDRILAVEPDAEPPFDAARTVDVDGSVVVPGLVDLHGDDLERHLFPRDGECVDRAAALRTCDRMTLAAGVTTKCHAVAFEDAPESHRSVEQARRLVDAVEATDGLLADHRVHARCEVADEGAVETVLDAIRSDVVEMASVMSHVPGDGQFDDVDSFRRRYGDGGSETAVESVVDHRREVPSSRVHARARRLVDAASGAGLVVAAHDVSDPDRLVAYADNGVDVCEFPLTMAVAATASRLGLTTTMGAPNVVRGGSLWDNLDARTALDAGHVDGLCSDHRPDALLRAPFVDTGEPLHRRVARVTTVPADALGEDRRGRLREGAIADVVVVDPDPVPTVEYVYRGGREVFAVGRSR